MKATDNPNWNKVHLWIKSRYGKADKCVFCNKKSKKYEWSLKKGKKYAKDINNFQKLCVACHRNYDNTMPKAKQKLFVVYNGKKQCLSYWSKELNIPISTLKFRYKNKWETELMLSKTKQKGSRYYKTRDSDCNLKAS